MSSLRLKLQPMGDFILKDRIPAICHDRNFFNKLPSLLKVKNAIFKMGPNFPPQEFPAGGENPREMAEGSSLEIPETT